MLAISAVVWLWDWASEGTAAISGAVTDGALGGLFARWVAGAGSAVGLEALTASARAVSAGLNASTGVLTVWWWWAVANLTVAGGSDASVGLLASWVSTASRAVGDGASVTLGLGVAGWGAGTSVLTSWWWWAIASLATVASAVKHRAVGADLARWPLRASGAVGLSAVVSSASGG